MLKVNSLRQQAGLSAIVKASAALMDALSERLSKEDYALVEELREQVAIAQCEENESRFKYAASTPSTPA